MSGRPCGRQPSLTATLAPIALTASAEPTVTIAHLAAAVVRDGDWYVVRCLEATVTSQGESVDAALANLTEALELYFEDAPLIDAPQPIVAPIEVRISA